MNEKSSAPEPKPIRWWPAILIGLVATGVVVWIRWQDELPFQQRNLRSLAVLLITALLLFLWWLLLSRARWKLRLLIGAGFVGVIALTASLFRIRGVSGDLLPILEPRWATRDAGSVAGPVAENTRPQPTNAPDSSLLAAHSSLKQRPDYPQFCGPNRDSILAGPALDPDWAAHPPQLLWRRPVGAAWSGFVIVGNRAVTQEQAGEEELVTCHDLITGNPLWRHADTARYATTIGGEGPRATPTVVSNRVFTLGATGLLNCLDLATGQRLWQRAITADAKSKLPDWAFASSPLVSGGLVLVSAGGADNRSLLAYRADTGEPAWTGGTRPVNYSAPFAATLAGVPQVLMFNSKSITAHDPRDGAVLWEYPWGVGQPHVALPVVTGTNRVVFSSGYGVGAELLEIRRGTNGALAAERVWKSPRLKSKFHNFIARDGFLYGLDDGIFACVDLRDGSQRWKEGRYGHGQGLLVGDLYLLMSEGGELVLLRPTPEAPNELHRFRVFSAKSWNPIALAGDVLLARTDQEAACLRLTLAK